MRLRLLLSLLGLSLLSSTYDVQLQKELRPILPPFISPPLHYQSPALDDHLFTFRHVFHHGNLVQPALHRRFDIQDPESALWIESESGYVQQDLRNLVTKAKTTKVQRLKNRNPSQVDPLVAAAREYSQVWASAVDIWTIDDVKAPDTTDLDTVLTFAQMSANAYLEKLEPQHFQEIHGSFNPNETLGFGWHGDGLQGYIYADETNSTVVISFKGTSMAIWDGAGTTRNDKENDNLFFSCCCGQQGSAFYRQVCDCATSAYTCDVKCLKSNLKQENRYYAAGRHLYNNVTAMYPKANIWLTGHSLGGSIASLIGLTYGSPVLTFQAVPDALPASRIGIPVPPGTDPDRPSQRNYTGAFHFGHNADPIYMGTCNGATASCSYAGYALETVCHTGQECVWDIVDKNQTKMSIITHKISYVINNVIKKWGSLPQCYHTPECYDCVLWKDFEGNGTSTSTSSISPTTSNTHTQRSTCKTPGWWGCLDETTSSLESSTSLKMKTTSTCKTPGLFGCNDAASLELPYSTHISSLEITGSVSPTPAISEDTNPTSTNQEFLITLPPQLVPVIEYP